MKKLSIGIALGVLAIWGFAPDFERPARAHDPATTVGAAFLILLVEGLAASGAKLLKRSSESIYSRR